MKIDTAFFMSLGFPIAVYFVHEFFRFLKVSYESTIPYCTYQLFNISEDKGVILNPLRLVLVWNRFLSIFENSMVKASIIYCNGP